MNQAIQKAQGEPYRSPFFAVAGPGHCHMLPCYGSFTDPSDNMTAHKPWRSHDSFPKSLNKSVFLNLLLLRQGTAIQFFERETLLGVIMSYDARDFFPHSRF